MTKLKDDLKTEEKSKHAKFIEEIREDLADTNNKVDRSRIMDKDGQRKTSESNEMHVTIIEGTEATLLERNLKAIDEAHTGVVRAKFDSTYESDSDKMSSVGSFDNNSEKSEEKPKSGNNDAFSIVEQKESKKLSIWVHLFELVS
jgi:hypothetical protein